MRTVHWAEEIPPRPPRPTAKVWTCPAVGTHHVRLLGPCTSVWLHWTGSRTLPCADNRCPWCLAGIKQALKHYAPALVRIVEQSPAGNVTCTWRAVVCDLTAEAYAGLDPAPGRGDLLLLKRKDARSNSELLAKRHEEPLPDLATLPEPFNVKPVLMHLWSMAASVVPLHKGGKGPQASGPGQQIDPADDMPELIPFPAQSQKGGA